MNATIDKIVALLDKAGSIRYPKAEGAKGLLVFNPVNLDIVELEKLASTVPGLSVVNTATPSFYENRQVPPHVWVGPAKDAVSVADGGQRLVDELGL
jgi:hypothetical protein